MELDPRVLIGPVGGVPVVIGIVEAIKTSLPARWNISWPILVFVVSLLWNEGVGLYLHDDPWLLAIAGVLCWLAAEKVYEHATSDPTPRRG